MKCKKMAIGKVKEFLWRYGMEEKVFRHGSMYGEYGGSLRKGCNR